MAEETVFWQISDTEAESMQRYSFARERCSGKIVLEIGCGQAYCFICVCEK